MKTFIYPRLAWDGIRKNRRMFFPYVLTCICVISIFYILAFLATPQTVALLPRGGRTAQAILTFGCIVIAIFSMIFLYYTNSFLIRRRAAEFGLYSVLGMNRGNLARIITMESLITSGISILSGLLVGIVLAKLAELGLVRMIGGAVTYDLRIDMSCVGTTVLCYLVIFGLIWLSSVIKVSRNSTVSLLKSDRTGEKAPKANWLLGIAGTLILTTAYYIAVSIDNPILAIPWFFLAVVLVIIATYLLLIAGSVLLCRILQKNKRYYYNPDHFVSVSSMVYRMKRNGAGLASIAIIATMVLVTISSVSCLWFGSKDMIDNLYPGDINIQLRFDRSELLNDDNLDAFRRVIEDFRRENGAQTETIVDFPYAEATGIGEENHVDFTEYTDTLAVNRIRNVFFIPLSVYNRLTDQSIKLNAGEALAFLPGSKLDYDTLEFKLGSASKSYRLLSNSTKEVYADSYTKNYVPQINLVISDLSDTAEFFETGEESAFNRYLSFVWKYSFDVRQSAMSVEDYADGLVDAINAAMANDPDNANSYVMFVDEKALQSIYYMEFNGSLFFIGVMLSVVFILAAVLIIYYKQISEGYEDSRRFEVMRKVGMTKEEIRTSINSQLLVVFFIPLLFAGLHLAFAFPLIEKMIILFGVYNNGLLILTTLISFAVFAVFYALVYRVTSNVYYRIVTDAI